MAIPGIINTTNIVDTINSNLPDSLKAKGSAKLSQIINDQSTKVASLMLPLALKYAQELGIDPNNLSVPDICPSENTLNTILPPLNGLIDDLNQVGDLLTNITKIVGSVALGGQILQTTSNTLNNVLPALQTAILAFPPTTLPGAVVGAVDAIDYANQKLLFKKDGTPALPPINSAIGSASINLVVASGFILLVTNLLEVIIALLKQCFPDASINTVNPSVLSLADSAKPKDQVNSLQGYKGFNLEIVEVPYNDKLTQRKAVARNQSGEIILQTELSFTTENNILINELKNIIDQSGLIGNVTENPTTTTVEPSILLGTGSQNPKDVRLSIVNTKTSKVLEKLKIQLGLNAYLRIPPPPIPSTTTPESLSSFVLSTYNWVNEVERRKPESTENSQKTINKNIPIVLNYLRELQSLITDREVIEGRVSRVNIPLDTLNNPITVSI
jgi:hypothetical protein